MSVEKRTESEDSFESPPFFRSWKAWYGLLIGELAVLIGLFALITYALS